MHINKRDNGFRFQESRLKKWLNFGAIWVGLLLFVGGVLTPIYTQVWQVSVLTMLGGVLVVVAGVSINSDRSLYGRDAQGRTRGSALMDFWRDQGFNGRYPLRSYSEPRSWLDLKDNIPTYRVYCHHDGLVVTIREDEAQKPSPWGRYYRPTRSIKIMTLKSESVVYELCQEGDKAPECTLDSNFPQDVLWAVLQGFAKELPAYAQGGVGIHELLHPRVDGAVPQLLPLPPLQAA